MNNSAINLVIGCTFLLLTACQTLPQIPYDRAQAGSPKQIELVTAAAPARPSVVLASTVGQSFGLVGALIDAGLQDAREDKFEKIAAAHNFSATGSLSRQLTSSLKTAGYDVKVLDVARPNREFLAQYPADAKAPVDAYLDVTMDYGYIAAGMSTAYRPYVYASCKLVKASDHSTLMQRTIAYNPLRDVPEQAISIAPDPAYEFTDFDALMADPDRSVKGLDEAVAQVANSMTSLLR